jgi:hypothetical protein
VAARIAKIQADALSSLAVSESKAKKLDELYREANAENEALYARFNDELARVLKSVRSGQGIDELKNKVRESQDEAGRLRRENARLKREVLGLRSQLKEWWLLNNKKSMTNGIRALGWWQDGRRVGYMEELEWREGREGTKWLRQLGVVNKEGRNIRKKEHRAW